MFLCFTVTENSVAMALSLSVQLSHHYPNTVKMHSVYLTFLDTSLGVPLEHPSLSNTGNLVSVCVILSHVSSM